MVPVAENTLDVCGAAVETITSVEAELKVIEGLLASTDDEDCPLTKAEASTIAAIEDDHLIVLAMRTWISFL